MGRFFLPLTNLVIPNGGTASNAIIVPDDAAWLVIYVPATLTAAVTVQVEPTKTGTAFVPLQNPYLAAGTMYTVTANSALIIPNGGFGQFRVNSAGAEGAARTFVVTAQDWM